LTPAIRADCKSNDIEILAAGASIGAFNAVSALCRHPDVFRAAVAMSGTYDLSPQFGGSFTDDFYFSSPLHYLPGLQGEQLEHVRERFVLLATGSGEWEDPEQTWTMAGVLGAKGIPNRVDIWSERYRHDWVTWREMLPLYLDTLA
jgi:esterase/lipase superfamily enzyme